MDLTEIIIKEIPEDTKKISITAGRVKIIDFGWGSLVEKEIPAISVYAELKNGEKVYRVYDVRTFWERNFIDNGEGYNNSLYRARFIGENLKIRAEKGLFPRNAQDFDPDNDIKIN